MNVLGKNVANNGETYIEEKISKYTSLIHILNDEEEFLLDNDGFIITSNLEVVNITGYDEYEVIGKHISIFYRMEEKKKASEDLKKASRLGTIFVTGLHLKKRSVHFWAKMKIESMASKNKDAPHFRVILQDITHRALSKERVDTIKDEYLSIFNNPFVGTFKFRLSDYSIQMCNQKTLDIIGKSNIERLSISNFFFSHQQFEQFIEILKKEKRVDSFKFLAPKAKDCWATISARYFEKQGFAEGILLDVSEQHLQMQQLKQVNAELDNFVYHASHDLRSPLTSIMGLVELGLNEKSIDTLHHYMSLIKGRINHMDVLLNDLITISYNNETAKQEGLFQFESEIDSIIKLLGNQSQSFILELEVVQPIEFKTDPIRLRAILRNLISNAFKYYNPSISRHYLTIIVRVESTHCAIQIKDNGIGIAPEFKSKVYDMFFRATDRSTGTGLGLYIVKSMVDKLNGNISFESTLNVGTTFLLTIPNHL